MRKEPGLALTVVGTIALGIGACLAVFSYLHGMLLAGLPFRDAERLVRIESMHGSTPGNLSQLEVRDLNQLATRFEGFATFRRTQYTIDADQDPTALQATINTYNLFDLLGVKPLLGTTWPASDDGVAQQFAVVIGYDTWQGRFGGDPQVVGKQVQLDRYSYTVLGVMPQEFDFPAGTQIYRRVSTRDYDSRAIRSASVIARLKPGTSVEQAQAELDAIAGQWSQLYPETNSGLTLVVRPLREYWIGNAAPVLRLLLLAAIAVGLLTAVNVTTLLLARAVREERAWALRSALGAGSGTLLRTMLAENLTLALTGAAAALLLAAVVVRALERMLPFERPVWMTLGVSWPTVVVAVLLALLLAAAVSLVPWFRIRTAELSGLLRAGGRGLAAAGRGMRALVITQIALAFALVTLAVSLVSHLNRLEQTPLGFNPERLLTLQMDPPWTYFNNVASTAPLYNRLIDELRVTPGVQAVAANDVIPFSRPDPSEGVNRLLPVIEGQSAAEAERNGFVNSHLVSPDYFAAVEMKLLSGRTFVETDVEGAPLVAVISRRTARTLWGEADPIGKRFRTVGLDANYRPNATAGADTTAEAWINVIGVVDDVREGGLLADVGADLYMSYRQGFTPETYFLIRTQGAPLEMIASLREVIRRVDPTQAVFDVRDMEARVAGVLWRQHLAAMLLRGFAVLALLVAGIGLFGLMQYQVTARRRSFGVKLAIGARPAGLVKEVLSWAAGLTLAGIVTGGVLASALSVVIQHLIPDTGGVELLHGAGALLVLSLLALVAAAWPAARAARTNPNDILRDD